MTEGITRTVLRLFRVPPEPHLPAGAPESARVFRAGANYWKLRLAGWAIRQAFTLAGFVLVTTMLATGAETARLRLKKAPPPEVFMAPLAVIRVMEMAAIGLWLV